jgi:hypothetical protein
MLLLLGFLPYFVGLLTNFSACFLHTLNEGKNGWNIQDNGLGRGVSPSDILCPISDKVDSKQEIGYEV